LNQVLRGAGHAEAYDERSEQRRRYTGDRPVGLPRAIAEHDNLFRLAMSRPTGRLHLCLEESRLADEALRAQWTLALQALELWDRIPMRPGCNRCGHPTYNVCRGLDFDVCPGDIHGPMALCRHCERDVFWCRTCDASDVDRYPAEVTGEPTLVEYLAGAPPAVLLHPLRGW
jgi:hypothetical protein